MTIDQLRKRASERQVEYRNHVNYAEYCACVTGDLCAFGRRLDDRAEIAWLAVELVLSEQAAVAR